MASLPPLKIIRVGTDMMPSFEAVSCASSTSTFTTLSLPVYSVAISSITGASALHGPHQVAWKSTRTGVEAFRTSASHD